MRVPVRCSVHSGMRAEFGGDELVYRLYALRAADTECLFCLLAGGLATELSPPNSSSILCLLSCALLKQPLA